jgi:hypothetical protein
METPDARLRRSNRRLLAAIAVFAVLFGAAIVLWKAFWT